MSPSYVRWLAIAGIIIGTVGVFFFGVLAILIAIVLFGLSIIGLAATVTGPTPTPRLAGDSRVLHAAESCWAGSRSVPVAAEKSSTRTRRASRPPTAETCSCRAGNSRRKWARPDLDWRPSGYQPDAPTGLSYGPAVSRKKKTRLKRCLASDPIATASTTVSGSDRNSTYGFSSGE